MKDLEQAFSGRGLVRGGLLLFPPAVAIDPKGRVWHRLFAVFLGAMTAGAGAGCNEPRHTPDRIVDSSLLVVEPGRGVPGVCELGMSLKELRTVTGDAMMLEAKHSRARFFMVPSLGLTGVPDEQGRVGLLTFHVQHYDSSDTVPGMLLTNTFRGRIGEWLTFSNHLVSRMEVEATLGPVRQYVTNYAQLMFPKENPEVDGTQPFSLRGERLCYPALGLDFEVQGDAVTAFVVYRPTGAD